jgi:hypothetical protein
MKYKKNYNLDITIHEFSEFERTEKTVYDIEEFNNFTVDNYSSI